MTIVDNYPFKDQNIKPILYDLVRVFALKSLIDDCGAVFDSGYFSHSAFKNLKLALDIAIKRMRPHLIPLIESVALPDELLPSSIGNSYGDIYEQQLELAKGSTLNLQDKDGIPSNFETFIKPFLHEEPKAKL